MERTLVDPSVHSMASYQNDLFSKMLHRVILFICGLSDSQMCLVCNTQKDAFDHVFTGCCKWQDTLRIAQKYLCQHGIRISRSTNIFKQLLPAKRDKIYISVLLTTYYTKRQTLRPQAIVATYIDQLRLVERKIVVH